MGLTGLEVVGKDGESLPLDLSMMAASPRDLNDLPDYGRDLRTLDKYVYMLYENLFISFSTSYEHILASTTLLSRKSNFTIKLNTFSQCSAVFSVCFLYLGL